MPSSRSEIRKVGVRRKGRPLAARASDQIARARSARLWKVYGREGGRGGGANGERNRQEGSRRKAGTSAAWRQAAARILQTPSGPRLGRMIASLPPLGARAMTVRADTQASVTLMFARAGEAFIRSPLLRRSAGRIAAGVS